MKLIKKIAMVSALSMAGMTAQAEGLTIGTGVLADIGGVLNAYVEFGLGSNSAMTIEAASVSNFTYGGNTFSGTGFGATYKYYVSGDGLFLKGGASMITVSSGSASAGGVVPIVLVGYEGSSGSMVYGVEGGMGTTAGMGILNLYLGMRL